MKRFRLFLSLLAILTVVGAACRIANADGISLIATPHTSQFGQLLRQRALLQVHARAQFIQTDLAAAQLVQDPDSRGVSQRFEELCLEWFLEEDWNG